MVKERIYINDLHFEHKLWDKELDFFKEEISFLEHHLSEIAHKYTDLDILKKVEHFQNQFLLQKSAIRDLQHEIKSNEHNLAQYAQEHPVAIDHRYFDDHKPLRDKVEREKAIYQELKKEFLSFVSRWM